MGRVGGVQIASRDCYFIKRGPVVSPTLGSYRFSITASLGQGLLYGALTTKNEKLW